MIHRFVIIASTFLALSACAPQAKKNVGPGINFVSPDRAAGLYKQVCVRNVSDFKNVPATLARLPFQRETETDIYYHQELNLSFRLGQGKKQPYCGMVWASVDPEKANLSAIRSVAPRAQVEQTPLVGFFRAVIPERGTQG